MKVDTVAQWQAFEKASSFLEGIGIQLEYRELEAGQCFLPGFSIAGNCIRIDKSKMKFPGDLLHEASHIAVVPANERAGLSGENIAGRKDAAAEEMMCIAWSYAACIHLNIDPHFVFHEAGYKGGGAEIVTNFNNGNYFGVPVLAWLGMTNNPSGNRDQPVYPAMIKWLRD